MLKRESLINEFWSRASEATGIERTARNPVAMPSSDDMPLVNIFDFQARAKKSSGGGKAGLPTITFEMAIHMEVFVAGTSDETASNELMTSLTNVMSSIYSDGSSLGSNDCLIEINEMTRIFRPPIGDFVAAIGVSFNVYYVEDLNNL